MLIYIIICYVIFCQLKRWFQQRRIDRAKTARSYSAQNLQTLLCKIYFVRSSHIHIVRKTHARYIHYMQSDEWRITISISSGNRCENFTEPSMDVPRNKGNYVPRELLARKTGRRKFRDPFWYSATEFIMAVRRSHERFPVPQAKFETLRHHLRLFCEKIFAKQVSLFAAA